MTQPSPYTSRESIAVTFFLPPLISMSSELWLFMNHLCKILEFYFIRDLTQIWPPSPIYEEMIRYRHSLHVCAQKMEWDGTPINVKETVNTECNFTVPVRSKIHSLIGKWYMDGWWRRRTLNLTSTMSCASQNRILLNCSAA